MIERPLDLDTVDAFLRLAELKSFTRAAEATGTTQSAVSLKLKRLETRLQRRLVERTPRTVRLTPAGEAFLDRARELMSVHARALRETPAAAARLAIGISDHVVGADLPTIVASLAAAAPECMLAVTVGFSRELLDRYDAGELDAVLIRRDAGRRDGDVLGTDAFGWFAAPRFRWQSGAPLRLASLAAPCGVRAATLRALDRAGIPKVESFVGGGIAAVGAAVTAAIGVAALAKRIAPPGAIDVGGQLGLPMLPPSTVVLHARVSGPQEHQALRTLAAMLRPTLTR